ncbi:hypothetical protein EMPS_02640 [Entomortierella parvispora]|uniref:RWD domain-containing protein n=1 Tax=Entomortierella parvispora TaxID=205924 RepID=A0A9P3H555_9FUNG|nr:hypothetical protein EMPS_02640 [Entomortierella parvispora]
MDSALEEEALAIVSIYGPASFYRSAAVPTSTSTSTFTPPVYTLKVSLEEPDFDYDPTTESHPHQQQLNHFNATKGNKEELELRLYFPEGYPETNTTAPVHEIVSIYYGNLRLTDAMIKEIDQGLEDCFVPGEVVVFSWIEWLRSYLEDLPSRASNNNEDEAGESEEEEEEISDDEDDDDHEGEEEGSKPFTDYFAEGSSTTPGDHSALASSLQTLSVSSPSDPKSPRASGLPVLQIRTGPPIVDRKSVFVAHLAAIKQPGEVPWMIQQLKQENKKVIKATHNIMAYRVENENGTIAQDNDDDGETAAGSRLLHLMSILDVKNVVVVVSRWYGGIPLSADRFKHINNAARLLLDECGYIQPAAASGAASTPSSSSKKKTKGKKAGKR